MKKLVLTSLQQESLRAAIIHWEENLEKARKGLRYNTQGSQCQLCADFYEPEKDDQCEKCPVKLTVTSSCCHDTPLVKIKRVSDRMDFPLTYKRNIYQWATITKAELSFLQNILRLSTLK